MLSGNTFFELWDLVRLKLNCNLIKLIFSSNLGHIVNHSGNSTGKYWKMIVTFFLSVDQCFFTYIYANLLMAIKTTKKIFFIYELAILHQVFSANKHIVVQWLLRDETSLNHRLSSPKNDLSFNNKNFLYFFSEIRLLFYIFYTLLINF